MDQVKTLRHARRATSQKWEAYKNIMDLNASVDRQKKQTNLRFDRLCGFDGSAHAQSTQALTVRLCLRKAVTYENLNAREGGLRRNS